MVGGVSCKSLEGKGRNVLLRRAVGVLRRGSGAEAVGGLGLKRKDPCKTVWRELGDTGRKEEREGS